MAVNIPAAMDKLTPREKEVYSLLLEGSNAKDIGLMLGISINTVQTHIKSIRRKLGMQRLGWARLHEAKHAHVKGNQNHPVYPKNTQNGD